MNAIRGSRIATSMLLIVLAYFLFVLRDLIIVILYFGVRMGRRQDEAPYDLKRRRLYKNIYSGSYIKWPG